MSNKSTRLSWEAITLQLQTPFQVSYGVSKTRKAFWLRLANDAGWGESAIPPYYGIDEGEIIAYWEKMAQKTIPFPDDPAAIGDWVGTDGPAPARCALDLALHDRIGRQQGVPLYELLGLKRPFPTPTAYTIGINPPDEMARQAAQVPNYPILKIKLGSDDDLARLTAVRAARPDAELCVDANGGWTVAEAIATIEAMHPFNLTFIEQPVPKDEIEGMGTVQSHTNLPIVADESVQTMADIEKLAAVGVQGINIKLMKVGGITPALQMINHARKLGLRIMLGCMVETTLGVTAMAHLASLAEWFDLDAPLLIANDPFKGARYDEQAHIHLPNRAGIGIIPT